MDVKEIISQYKDVTLCQEWNNNIPSDKITGNGFILLDLTQEIKELCIHFPFLPVEDITAALVTFQDGDYLEVYVTESSRPYASQAIFHPLEYYLED